MPALACNRGPGEETDRGKPLERQITGLDKLHFCCDHESCFDVSFVFFFIFDNITTEVQFERQNFSRLLTACIKIITSRMTVFVHCRFMKGQRPKCYSAAIVGWKIYQLGNAYKFFFAV